MLSLLLATVFTLSIITSFAFADDSDSVLKNVSQVDNGITGSGSTLYSSQEVALSLISKNKVEYNEDVIYTERTVNNASTVLNDVLLPTSMGLETPKVDMSKIEKSALISTLDPAFAEAVAKNTSKTRSLGKADMTLSEYYALEDTWLLPADIIRSANLHTKNCKMLI